jgi:superfamily II DNA or RNA helicase
MKSIEDINKIKNSVQEAALNCLSNHKNRGIIEVATGVGKTKIGCDLISDVVNHNVDNRLRAIIICPTKNLRDNEWKNELAKWCGDEILQWINIEIKCINSVYKLRGEYYDVIIIDEVHTTLSEKYSDFLRFNNAANVLGLSATVSDTQVKRDLLSELKLPIIFRYDLNQAERDGIIADYEAYNLAIDLTEEESKAYQKYTSTLDGISSAFGEQRQSFENIQRALQGRYVCKGKTMAESIVLAKTYMKAIGDRKKLVFHAEYKYKNVILLACKYHSDRIIVFSEDIEFVETMYRYLDECEEEACKYHSHMNNKDKKESLELFRTGEARIMVSAKALNAGFNVPEANVGISAGGTSTKLDDTQRRGRILRPSENKTATYINLYCKNTVEERWVGKRSLNKKITWINSIEDING